MIRELSTKIGVRIPPEHSSLLKPEKVTCSKGEYITRAGEVENYIYYLVKGGVKVMLPAEKKNLILDFWFEGDFFSSYSSFLQRQPSRVDIIALDEIEAERVHYQVIQQVYTSTKEGNEIGRKIAEMLYLHKTQREIDLLTLTAEERYVRLLQKSNQLINKVPVNQIASYLGIHPESLSRIRRKVIS